MFVPPRLDLGVALEVDKGAGAGGAGRDSDVARGEVVGVGHARQIDDFELNGERAGGGVVSSVQGEGGGAGVIGVFGDCGEGGFVARVREVSAARVLPLLKDCARGGGVSLAAGHCGVGGGRQNYTNGPSLRLF